MVTGFTGVLLITRPSAGGFDKYSVMALLVVAGVAVRDILTRQIPASIPALIVALANGAFVMVGSFALALLEGGLIMPDAIQMAYLGAAGMFLALGYLFMVQTLRYADISASATIRFSVVLWALLSGVVIFREWPDSLAIVGMLLIVGAGVYTLHREAKLKRQRTAQAAEYAQKE
jgi:drug/metabolite transporter (DMT)-like permease